MIEKNDLDEYLECLWHMKEDGVNSLGLLKQHVGVNFDAKYLNVLKSDGLVKFSDGGENVALTTMGEAAARRLIRSHRLAETLLYTVFGQVSEPLACEFEHMVISEIVDSICSLLSHPRECPHGKPIPEGDCCKRAVVTSESLVIPLTNMKVGCSTRIAYINYKSEQQFYQIESLHLSRGSVIKLLQNSPAYVIDCEDANVVFDDEIASQIFVWKNIVPVDGRISAKV
ncbi:MAG: metal-dependent transcriptional regulator [Candidatus Omnitrophica bacterium]|nr:metal-dependent transcriptional regulator [Candidatus Omnitrophota bacterium]